MRLKRRARSSGSTSAPETHSRTERRSRDSAPASSIIRYMAGTPMKTVARRCSMASSTSSASERGHEVDGDAGHRQAEQGEEAHDVGDGQARRPPRPAAATAATWRRPPPGRAGPRWVSSAPLGKPGGARRVEDGGHVGRVGRERRRPSGSARTSSARRTTSAAPESATTWSISARRMRRLTGTATPPARQAASDEQEQVVAVRHGHDDPVAGADPASDPARQPVDPVGRLAIGERGRAGLLGPGAGRPTPGPGAP